MEATYLESSDLILLDQENESIADTVADVNSEDDLAVVESFAGENVNYLNYTRSENATSRNRLGAEDNAILNAKFSRDITNSAYATGEEAKRSQNCARCNSPNHTWRNRPLLCQSVLAFGNRSLDAKKTKKC